MSTETVEERIEREVAAGMRLHNLKQAGERLHKVRTQLKDIRGLLEDDKPLADEVGRIVVNEIEILMWKIETAIIEQVKPKQEGK